MNTGKTGLKKKYFYTYFHKMPQIKKKKLSIEPAYDVNV